jgi:carbohydrate diacid regulator
MELSHTLAHEIRNYIKNLLSKDVIIVDTNGAEITANGEVSSKALVPLSQDVLSVVDSKTMQIDGTQQLIIPLRYQTETVAVLLLNDNSNEVKNYVPLIKSFAELLVQQYIVINKPVLDSTDQFITKLLNNATAADLPLYESEAKVLGYNLKSQRIAIVVHLKNFWEKCLASFDQPTFEREEVIKDWKRKIENQLTSFFTKNTDNIIAYIGNDKFIIFKSIEGDTEENVVKLLKNSHKAVFDALKNFNVTDTVVGFGNSYTGIQGLIDSYREADLALEFGARLWGDNKSYYFGDLGILSILGEGNREKEVQFANQLLQQLSNEDLIETLECFFTENLNLTETAHKMGIHRNTVIYRLNQITNILGVDPRIFEQAMTIKIALLVKKLFG